MYKFKIEIYQVSSDEEVLSESNRKLAVTSPKAVETMHELSQAISLKGASPMSFFSKNELIADTRQDIKSNTGGL